MAEFLNPNYMKCRRCLLGLLAFLMTFLFLTPQARGQGIVVHGKVIDNENGNPMPGATIVILGTTVGTTAGTNGDYSLASPNPQDTLVFSFIGYKTRKVPIRNRTVVNVRMSQGALSEKQVVVIGYGTQQKQDVNGSISQINSKEFKNTPVTSVAQLLQGRAAGVEVSQNSGMPGSSMSIYIRGVTSITGSNQPLYVVDGVPMSGEGSTPAFEGTGGNETTSSPISFLNPNDIESITVLKDASAEAIYGSRGANGVVIITTKKGQPGQSHLTYNGSVGFQTPENTLKVLNLRQFATLENEYGNLWDQEALQPSFARPEILGEGTNWQNAIFRLALSQDHQLSFSGGNDRTTYYIAGEYLNQDGIVIGSTFKRYTVQFHIDTHITDWLKAGINTTLSNESRDMVAQGDVNGLVSTALKEPPSLPVYNTDGTFSGVAAFVPGQPYTQARENPVALALTEKNFLGDNKVIGSAYLEATLFKGLTFRTSFGGNFIYQNASLYDPAYHWGQFVNAIATAKYNQETDTYWDFQNYFTYEHSFNGNQHITFLLGQEAQKSLSNTFNENGQGFLTDIHTLNLAQPVGQSNSSGMSISTISSYYSRLIYSYKNKYSLTASIRADGSSVFAPGNQWGYFPAVAASWKVFEEPFMQKVNRYIDALSIKAGYGITGNQDIAPFLYTSTLNPLPTGIGIGFAVNNIANPNLKWELQKQLNLGISFSLFKDRLSADIEVYNKQSSRFLYSLPLPIYLTGDEPDHGGMAPPTINLGSMRNRGIDVTIGYQTIDTKGFTWSSSLTFSHNVNDVASLFKKGFDILQTVDENGVTYTVTQTQAGQPVGQFYGYKAIGLFTNIKSMEAAPKQFGQGYASPTDPRPGVNPEDSTWLGDVQYADVNGDGVIDGNDQTVIGNPHPIVTFGFNNSFTYKNFNLSIFLQGSLGNDILNVNSIELTSASEPGLNQLYVQGGHWSETNPNGVLPRITPDLTGPNNFISTRLIESGSYMKIRSIVLGYTIPDRITKRWKIDKLNVYGSVGNLLTLTKYSGLDPDVGAYNQDVLLLGVDAGRYPEARSINFGLNITFF